MNIGPQERKWFTPVGLAATDSHGDPVVVEVTGWEASFDNGATWKSSRDDAGSPGWLVAGVSFPGPGDEDHGITADAVIPRGVFTRVQIRLRDNPETTIYDDLIITS